MATESFTLEWWAWFQSLMWVVLVLIGLIILYYIIKEMHDSKVTPRLAEIDLEKEKLQMMKLDFAHRGQPFFRITPEKIEEINTLDLENTRLEAEIFAKQSAVDQRIQLLENSVKNKKLDHLVEKIKEEERKIR
jgi:hypothetical protein